MWSHAVSLFQEYMGTGLIVIWFLIALVYLGITEKRKHIRILFVYVPVIILLLFFNPLLSDIVYEVAGSEIYYRILWLLPITVVLAYGTVAVLAGLEGIKRAAFTVVSVVLFMVSGSYIYHNEFFSRAENLYHVPQAVVDICEAIEVEGREVKAVFPADMLQYVRQYSPVICMPYGREVLVEDWIIWYELYDVMEAEEIDAERLAEGCWEHNAVYAILPGDKKIIGRLEDYDFEVFAEIDGYVVYKDANADLEAILKSRQEANH